MKNGEYKRKSGFTLVEMMVSVGIFTLVVTMGVTSLVTTLKASHHSEVEKKVTDSLDYVLENLTREIRLGKNYYFAPPENKSGSASDGAGSISDGPIIGFDASDNRGYMIYSIKDGAKLWRRIFLPDGSSLDEVLTDESQVLVKKVQIRIMHTAKDDDKQPLVWLQIVGAIPGRKEREFTVQTLISQREIDAPPVQNS